jgi:hypothetical protein
MSLFSIEAERGRAAPETAEQRRNQQLEHVITSEDVLKLTEAATPVPGCILPHRHLTKVWVAGPNQSLIVSRFGFFLS